MISPMRTVAVVLVGVLAITMVGCSRPGTSTPAASASTAPETDTGMPPAEASTNGGAGHDTDETPAASESVLMLDAASTRSATATGTRVLRLFLRRDVTAERWYADLKPYLSEQAAADYEGTQPYKLPRASLTGAAATLAPDSVAAVARVVVPTSHSSFLVIVSRTSAEPGRWRMERVAIPEDLEQGS